MKLKEWDWDKQGFVEVEYPDGAIKDFIDWLRTTKQWRESPEQVFHKFQRFQAVLLEYKNDPEKLKRERRAAATQTARAAKAAKRKQTVTATS